MQNFLLPAVVSMLAYRLATFGRGQVLAMPTGGATTAKVLPFVRRRSEVASEPLPEASRERIATGRRATSRVQGPLTVYTRSSFDSAVLTRLPPITRLGSPLALLVTTTTPGWVEVSLPGLPKDRRGWVQAQDVQIDALTSRIDIFLSARRMRLMLDGTEVLEAPITMADQSEDAKIPTGRFFVTDRLRPANPAGAHGSFAIGLSAHADASCDTRETEQTIIQGIHPLDAPAQASIWGGLWVSHDVAARLAYLPLGTPVTIR